MIQLSSFFFQHFGIVITMLVLFLVAYFGIRIIQKLSEKKFNDIKINTHVVESVDVEYSELITYHSDLIVSKSGIYAKKITNRNNFVFERMKDGSVRFYRRGNKKDKVNLSQEEVFRLANFALESYARLNDSFRDKNLLIKVGFWEQKQKAE